MQIVHLHESNACGVVYSTHDGGVVTWRKIGDDGRFARAGRSVAAVLDGLDLALRDDAADDCLLPIVVRGNQSSILVV